MEVLMAAAIGILFGAGVFLILKRNVIRGVIGLIFLTNAVNLFLLSTGAYKGLEAPYISNLLDSHSDALPQALVLTAIVISMGATAVMLAMLFIISVRYGTADSDEVKGLKH